MIEGSLLFAIDVADMGVTLTRSLPLRGIAPRSGWKIPNSSGESDRFSMTTTWISAGDIR